MDSNIKENFKKKLETFISWAEEQLDDKLNKLGWTKEKITEKFEAQAIDEGSRIVECKYNPGHRLPLKSLEKHHEKCSMLSEDYSLDDVKNQLPSSAFFYEKSSTVTSVFLDEKTLNEILQKQKYRESLIYGNNNANYCEWKKVAKTNDRSVTELSVAERLAIYDYVAERGRNDMQIKLEDLQSSTQNDKNDEPKQKSQLEILAEQRDYKRRRQSYRAKNVHITKKSYTEVLKEVIESHTHALNYTKDEKSEETTVIKEEKSLNYDRRRSRSKSTDSERSNRHHGRRQRSKSSTKRERSSSYDRKSKHKKSKKHKSSGKKSHHHHRRRHSETSKHRNSSEED
ncbi:U11/U12 small nuclear ribonucleoprotein 48 kDa protein [Chamberlinius hualienensis]